MHVLSLNETLGSIPSITFCKEKLKKESKKRRKREKENNEEIIFWGEIMTWQWKDKSWPKTGYAKMILGKGL